ncbi:hypothetical protein B6N25_08365 [Sphingobacteriales bacterium TSM_CSS]|nr:hypothetical protein B6N25_08365 [Sphingobacteriales bacterium TSM_CSS]
MQENYTLIYRLLTWRIYSDFLCIGRCVKRNTGAASFSVRISAFKPIAIFIQQITVTLGLAVNKTTVKCGIYFFPVFYVIKTLCLFASYQLWNFFFSAVTFAGGSTTTGK